MYHGLRIHRVWLALLGLLVALGCAGGSSYAYLAKWDANLLLYLANYRQPWLDSLMLRLTWFGSTACITIVLTASTAYFLGRHRWSLALVTAGSGSLTALLLCVLKQLVQKPRPPQLFLPLVQEPMYGFPSGHAMMSAFAFGWLAYCLNQSKCPPPLKKLAAICLAWIIPPVIGFSRLYLASHYPSDVIGGLALGFICLQLTIMAAERGDS